MSDALFRSAHQALLFAFTYGDQQHAIAAAAERQIALQARERYERIVGAGRGLRGIDGAAQAGMIRSIVGRMHPLHQTVIVARFSALDVSARQAACAALAIRARQALPVKDPEVIVLLLRRMFGLRVDLGRMADEHEVDLRTTQRWAVSAKKWLRPIEVRAMDEAERVLCDAGIVAHANS